MLQGRPFLGQHTVVLAEELLGREIGGHHERLVGHLHRQHAVQRVSSHVVAREHQQIPAAPRQLQHVGLYRLFAHLAAKALVAHVHAAVQPDGLDNHWQVLLALRHVLQHDALLHRLAVGQRHVHRR